MVNKLMVNIPYYMQVIILLVVFAGWYMEPAVFTDVNDGTFIAEEESFGPIMVISKFPNGYASCF